MYAHDASSQVTMLPQYHPGLYPPSVSTKGLVAITRRLTEGLHHSSARQYGLLFAFSLPSDLHSDYISLTRTLPEPCHRSNRLDADAISEYDCRF